MKKPSSWIFTAVAAAIASTTTSMALAADFYVNATTTKATRTGASATPFKTLAEVNAAQADGRIKSGDAVLFACGAVWRTVETPLRIKSGVTYKSNGSCWVRPVITGGVTLSKLSWAAVAPGSKIFVATVPKDVTLDGVKIPITKISQLIDFTSATPSRLLQRARHPNAGDGAFNGLEGVTNSRFYKMGALTPQATADVPLTQVLHLDRAAWPAQNTIKTAADYMGATVFARAREWRSARYVVEGVDNASNVDFLTMRVEDPTHMIMDPLFPKSSAFERRGYWLENKLWMLDKPGEWYFDPATRKLYVWREKGDTPNINTAYQAVVGDFGITAGMRTQGAVTQYSGADADRASNFNITDFEIRDFAKDAISIMGNPEDSGAQTIAFNLNNLVIRRAGKDGIVVRAAKGNRADQYIQNMVIEDVAGDAIVLSGGMEPVLDAAGNYIPNTDHDKERQPYRASWLRASDGVTVNANSIARAGLDGLGYAAIGATGAGHAVTNNKLDMLGSRGIDFGASALVSRNTVNRACEVQNDCGAVYTVTWNAGSSLEALVQGQEPISFNTEVSSNVITNTLGTADGTAQGLHHDGIYLDDLARAITVKGNHVGNSRTWGVFLHGTQDVVVDSNTIVASFANSAGLGLGNSAIAGALKDARRNTASNNLIVASGTDAVTIEHGRALPPQGDQAGWPMTRGVAKYFRNHYVISSGEPFRTAYPDPGAQFGDRVSRPIMRQRLSFLAWLNQEGTYEAEDSFGEDGAHVASSSSGHIHTTRLAGVFANLPIDRIQGVVADPMRPWAFDANLFLPLGGHFDSPSVLQTVPWYAVGNDATLTIADAAANGANCFILNGCLGITPLPYLNSDGLEVKSWFNERRKGTPTTAASAISVRANPGDTFLLSFLAKSVYRDAQGRVDLSEKGDAIRPQFISRTTYESLAGEQPYFAVGSNMKSYFAPLTVAANAPANSEIRLDLWAFSNAQIQVDELELYKVTREPSPADRIFIDVNPTATSRPIKCSLPAGKVAADYRDLADRSKPLVCSGAGAQQVPAFGSRVFVWSPATPEGRKHQDTDGDRVPDGVDLELHDHSIDSTRVNGVNFLPIQ